MCSAGSSNVNILHPPSHSPVPGPGIPLPSNGRLVPTLFLFLSSFLSVTHKHTHRLLFSFCPYATTSKPSISFLLNSPHTFLHFLFASFTLPPFPFLPSIFFFFPPLQQPSISTISPSAALSFGFICMAERKGCRQCEQGQQSPPVSIQARAEICNARQHSAMQG